jgi:hypothetical protein
MFIHWPEWGFETENNVFLNENVDSFPSLLAFPSRTKGLKSCKPE